MDSPDLHILIVTPDLAAGKSLETALAAKHVATVLSPPGLPAELPEIATTQAAIVDGRCPPELLERLSKSHDHVIFAGDRENSADVLRALRSGASDYLPRDFRPDELDEAISRALSTLDTSPAVLELESGGTGPRQTTIRGKSFTIGRDASNDLSLDSVVVSRFHARIERRGPHYSVADCGSRHGIFVDNQKVEQQLLSDGAKIRLGNAGAPVLVFREVKKSPETGAGSGTRDTSDARTSGVADSSQEMRDIAALLDTFLKLNGDLLLEDLLQIVVARSIEMAEAERGLILLSESSGLAHPDGEDEKEAIAPDPGSSPETRLHLAMARNRDGSPLEESGLLISHKIPVDVMRTGQGVILEDLLAPEKASVHPTTIELGVRSAMCVPLRVRRAGSKADSPPVLGVLYVDSTTRTRPFSPRLLHALESLASEAAQAIFNSRLYDESLEKRALDAEMRIARSIQKNLLPPSAYRNTWVELYGSSQASKEVGGDLLDYYPFGEDRVNIVVGDVSGKGIPAAIFSSMLDGLCYGLGAQAAETIDLGKSAGELNRYLVSKSGLAKFVSVIFGTLRSDGRFTYVNAGHNPPLLVRADGAIEVLSDHGVIMGMFEDAQYHTGEVRLEPGDALILYSDGVTEAKAKNGERLGIERLKVTSGRTRTRSPKEIHDAILAEANRFSGGAPPADDVTLMAVKYAPPARG